MPRLLEWRHSPARIATTNVPGMISTSPSRLRVRLALWARRVGLARKLAVALTIAAALSGFATFFALTESVGGPDPVTVLVLLNLDLVLLLVLGALVARRIALLWAERRAGAAGSALHVRLVALFSLVAVVPTILVAIFSAAFFTLGVESWFSDRVRTALMESRAVARAYLEEHQQIIGGDALAMANDINREGPTLLRNSFRLNQLIAAQAAIRNLTEAVVFEGSGRVIARSAFAFSMELTIEQIPIWAFERARNGEVAVLTTEDDDRVRALVQLDDAFDDTYLFVGRFVDPKVVSHMEQTNAAVAAYEQLEGRRSGLEITLTLVFLVVALLLLLAAVWVGLTLATRLARPIANLIDAAERVREGDLTARVADSEASGELGSLSRAFNRMTSQLDGQRRALVEANWQLDERRRFTEAVLTGVSAGVVGLDRFANINLPNRSACELLATDLHARIGQPLAEAVPEMAECIEAARRRPDKAAQHEIGITRDGKLRTLLVRVTAEQNDGDVLGYVVTFDDVTELLSAQRKAAWADVARRIAHEIKNPLTPIQLSAERLKRKYLKQIETDPETFVTCTDTIIRQVGDIGRMVDEFSAFARMPTPVIKTEDLRDIVRQTIFLSRNGFPGVTFELELPETPLLAACDVRLVGQALTNIAKNAAEAIQGREGEGLAPGRVVVRGFARGGQVVIEIEDNGRGLPAELRDRLTEPYVTTRAKGTGLGLAIVKKIMEDHGGGLELDDAPAGQGARVRLVFEAGEPAAQESAAGGTEETTQAHGA